MRATSIFVAMTSIALCRMYAQGQVELERVVPDDITQTRRVRRETRFLITPGGDTVPATGGFVEVEVRPERPTDRLRLRVGSTAVTTVTVRTVARERTELRRPSGGARCPDYFEDPRPDAQGHPTCTGWRDYDIGGDPLFRELCTGGCTLPLRVGDTYELAVVSPRDGTEYGARRFETRTVRVAITACTVALEVGYDRQTRKRRRRWITVGSMVLIGGALLGAAVPVRNGCDEGPCRDRAIRMFSVGGGAAFLGLSLLGVPIATRGRSYVRVVEAEPAPASTRP